MLTCRLTTLAGLEEINVIDLAKSISLVVNDCVGDTIYLGRQVNETVATS